MENFTPVSALVGGALIGLGAVMLMLATGRIAGISGILSGITRPNGGDWLWRVAFAIGLAGGAAAAMLAGIGPQAIAITGSIPLLAAGGLIVGFGTQLGSGCTSGHGVCGLARLSPRSLVATGIFMATGALTVFVMRHVIGG